MQPPRPAPPSAPARARREPERTAARALGKEPQRIAKLLARAGVASRREIERMIGERRVAVGGVPGALAPFKGRLLAGVGATLRIYEAGKKKLLRKCEHRKLPTHIATLSTLGDRIYVGDLQARILPC